MRFTPSSIFLMLSRSSARQISFRTYIRSVNDISLPIVGYSGWTEVTDRVEWKSFPESKAQIEYEIGQFTADKLELIGKGIKWWKTNVFITTAGYLTELKIEATIAGAADVIPYFTGWIDPNVIENNSLMDTTKFQVFTADDLGTRISAENLTCQPTYPNVGGAGVNGLILPLATGIYVTNANVSSYILQAGVHTISFYYNGGGVNVQAQLDSGPRVTVGAGGSFTLGDVDGSMGDTQRIKVYATGPYPTEDVVDKIIVTTAGNTLPTVNYKSAQVNMILSVLYNAIGITNQNISDLSFSTWDGNPRLFYIDTPPNNAGVPIGVKPAICSDGLNLYMNIITDIWRRDYLTGNYTKIISGIGTVEKLMFNARNNHLWIYSSGSLWQYDVGNATLSSVITLNSNPANVSHYGVQLLDYNYTGSSWKYGIVCADQNNGTAAGRLLFVDGNALTTTTITTGTAIGDTIYPYFTYIPSAGYVRFRVYKFSTSQHALWEFIINSSGVWTSNGEKCLGIDDYRQAIYNGAEGKVYYYNNNGAYPQIETHGPISPTPTVVYNPSDGSMICGAMAYDGIGKVYYTLNEAAGLNLYSASASVQTLCTSGVATTFNQMVWSNSRLWILSNSNSDGSYLYSGIPLYCWSNIINPMIPLADFQGDFVTDRIRTILNSFTFIGWVSSAKVAYVMKRFDSSGNPVTTGNIMTFGPGDAVNILEEQAQYPHFDMVQVTGQTQTIVYNGTGFVSLITGEARVLTISNVYIPDQIIKDVAYYAYQFFKTDRSLYIADIPETLWQYEPGDGATLQFPTGNIVQTGTGPIYATTLKKDGSMEAQVMI